MKSKKIELWTYYRPSHLESVEQRHAEVARNMREIGPPLGWRGLEVPPVPDFGEEELMAFYHVKYPIPGLVFMGDYNLRGDGKHFTDHTTDDDNLIFEFKLTNKNLDYREILREHYPSVVRAFRAYRARTLFDDYSFRYTGGPQRANPIYNKLLADKSINVNGRSNIFTLQTAMYWDALLCQRALGFDRNEVIRRLQGKVPLVMPLMDGVYTVFSDDPDLSYEEFAAYNDRFKPILGLI